MKNKVTTDSNGFGNTKYQKALTVRTPVTASLVDNDFYDPSVHLRLNVDSYPRIKTIIQNDASKIGTTHYNEKCKLNCVLSDENGDEVGNVKVKFKTKEADIKTPTVDDHGYGEVEYVPTTGKDFKYTCEVSNNGIHGSAEETFTVTNDKQTPLVTIKKSTDTIEYGDNLRISTGLTESAKSVKPNNPLSGYTLGLYTLPSSNNGNITFAETDETKLANVVTGKEGIVIKSFNKIPVGSYKIYSVFWGDKRDTKDQNTIISRNPLFHWAWNYCLVDVVPRTVGFEGNTKVEIDGGKFDKYIVTLVDKNGDPMAGVNVVIKVTNLSNDKTLTSSRTSPLKTNPEGKCGVDFVDIAPSSPLPHLLPCVIKGWNVGAKYKVEFMFNRNDYEILHYPNYKITSFTGTVVFTKADTSMIYVINEEEGLKVTLSRTAGGIALAGKKITFKEGKVSVTKTTNSNGIAILTSDDLEGGEHTLDISFGGDDLYNPCSITAKWTNVIIDDCTTLATFTTMNERWYGSYENYAWYNPRKYYSDRLRYYCNEYGKGKVEEDDGVTAETGVIMKCNNITCNGNCDITFKLKFKTGRKDHGFGAHFGLVQPNYVTAEFAPARFELFNNPGGTFNKYFIHDTNRRHVKSFKMSFEFDKWYRMVFQVRGRKVTCKNLDTNEQYTGTTDVNTEGLQPYIMTFLNYCETSIRELKMELK